MDATPDGRGCCPVEHDDESSSPGGAAPYGSTEAMHLNRPIVDRAATSDGGGCRPVGKDGGHSVEDAAFSSSTGATHRDRPTVRLMGATTSRHLVAADRTFDVDSAPFSKVAFTTADGTYRIDPPAGTYQLTITDQVGGQVVSSSTTIDATGGHAYDVTATVRSDGSAFFAPISGY